VPWCLCPEPPTEVVPDPVPLDPLVGLAGCVEVGGGDVGGEEAVVVVNGCASVVVVVVDDPELEETAGAAGCEALWCFTR
jgi:hypothetical protein